jgi:hypothetical protein
VSVNEQTPMSAFFFKVMDFVYYLACPFLMCFVMAWFLEAIGMHRVLSIYMVKQGVLVLSSFFSGVLLGLKIGSERGGMMSLFMGLLAIGFFSYELNKDVTIIEQYARYFPILEAATPSFFLLLLPGIYLLGVLFYRFFTVSPD